MTSSTFTDNPWLTPREQDQVIEQMLRFNILKWSNSRDLPLKSGGTTDIYVNMRQARNHPEAIKFFARMFCNPIFRLQSNRIAEIPQAVTCFAGSMADQLNLPLVTIRETAKEGRVSDANLIGEINHGEEIALFDDVITDGASKIAGYKAIKQRGGKPTLIVCVDRQQGWGQVFMENNIDMEVWPGMTLHDIRHYLVNHGFMERCSVEMEDKNPIILALDGKPWEEILPLIEQLRTTGTILKVNDLAAAKDLDDLLPKLQTYGRVMVDLKTHDIPQTMTNTCAHAAKHNPWAYTIHASAGKEAVESAVSVFKGKDTVVLAVTVLTSIDPKTSEEIFRRKPLGEVKKLAEMAWAGGARGFVCSPEEVSTLRRMFPTGLLVTPGVRSPGVDANEQKRTSTPAGAMGAGADYIVGGRQFLNHADPVSEVKRVLKEELNRW